MDHALPRTSTLLLALIAGIAITLSALSYQYSIFASDEIRRIATDDIRSSAEIEAHSIAAVLVNKIDSISTNLQILANAPTVQRHDVRTSSALFTSAQKSTEDITTTYFWVDKDGTLLWADAFATNQTLYQQYGGGDRSFRPYFMEPKKTLKPYYSTVIESLDGIPRLYVAYPIVDYPDRVVSDDKGDGTFKGVVAAAINLDILGGFLQSQLPPKFESSVGMMDRNGMILYSRNTTFIGKDIFGDEFQSIIPAEIKDSFNTFLRESLEGQPGSGDITYQGSTSTIAYQPATIPGNDFAVVYIVAPHKLAGSVEFLIEQQRTFNVILIASVGGLALGVAFLVTTWNKRLEARVETKTHELKRANDLLQESVEQLKLQDNMQQEFINIAAHELRTPTQAITGYSELYYIRPDIRDEAMKAIARNALRLERLTSDILDVTRIEGRKLDLAKHRFDLSEVISGAIEDIRSQIEASKLKFEDELRPIYVHADKTRINQVVSNLLSNAAKFTKQGTVTVSADVKDGEAVVSISDTGSGIDPQILPRLFTKFTSKSQTGTGLGLFISKSIIEAHGGKIRGENNRHGGATFTFSLPME